MIKFDISDILAENSVNLVICFSELYSKQPKSEIHQKMLMFDQLKN